MAALDRRHCLLGFILVVTACDGSRTPNQTTVCAIIKNPAEFDETVVKFRAAVLTDWHHGTLLFNPSCGGGIQLFSVETAPKQQSDVLDRAIGTLENGGAERTAVATFTGKLRVTPRYEAKQPRIFDNPLGFDAHAIEDVKFYPKR